MTAELKDFQISSKMRVSSRALALSVFNPQDLNLRLYRMEYLKRSNSKYENDDDFDDTAKEGSEKRQRDAARQQEEEKNK
jgi:hypothetical protein